MSTQLLIYEKVEPVTNQRHRGWSIKKSTDCTFAKHVNAVPLTALEFGLAEAEYAIVFTGTGETVMPSVILGMRDKQNLYLNEDGSWRAKYLPAFIRRYPFVFASDEGGTRFTLCLDEAFSGCNQAGLGERLFDAEGTRTQYLEGVLNFLQQYQGQFQLTQRFCKKLHELDLLEPMQAQITLPSGEKTALAGFMAVNRDRLKKLSAEKLAELVHSNELELIYIHLQSIRNLSLLADRLSGALGPDGPDERGGESTAWARADATEKGNKTVVAAQAT